MLDVRDSRELQATILALKNADRGIRLAINKASRTRLRPVWQQELNARTRTAMERRVIADGARATASDRGVTLMAATRRRPLRGGLVPADEWAGVEFGARTQRVRVRQRSSRGRIYERELTINRQFRSRRPHGMVAFDAASAAGTRIVAAWVKGVVEDLAAIPTAEVVR